MDDQAIEWLKEIVPDKKKGELNLAGHRHVIVDAASFRAYRDAISEILGHGSDAVLYLAGKRHTEDFVKKMLKKSMIAGMIKSFGWGRNKIGEKITNILTQYGFGAATIEKIDFDGESVIILKNSCIATSYDKKQKKAVCSYIAGLLAGGAKAITGKEYECRETHCTAKGDKHCRFLLKLEK